jgi:hypothetical protein
MSNNSHATFNPQSGIITNTHGDYNVLVAIVQRLVSGGGVDDSQALVSQVAP